MSIILRMVLRWPLPTWWQMVRSICWGVQCIFWRKSRQVRVPRSMPCLRTETESVDMNWERVVGSGGVVGSDGEDADADGCIGRNADATGSTPHLHSWW